MIDAEKNTFFSIYTLQLVSVIISLAIYCVFVGVFNKDSSYKYLYIVQWLNIVAALFDISWLFMGLEDFKKTVTDYLMYERKIDFNIFSNNLLNKILYSSVIERNNSEVIINLKKEVNDNE